MNVLDVTKLVVINSSLSEHCCVVFRALYAYLDKSLEISDTPSWYFYLNCELTSGNGLLLKHDLELFCNIYDSKERLVATQSEFVDSSDFYSVKTISFCQEIPVNQIINRVRLYPSIA